MIRPLRTYHRWVWMGLLPVLVVILVVGVWVRPILFESTVFQSALLTHSLQIEGVGVHVSLTEKRGTYQVVLDSDTPILVPDMLVYLSRLSSSDNEMNSAVLLGPYSGAYRKIFVVPASFQSDDLVLYPDTQILFYSMAASRVVGRIGLKE